MVKKYNAGCPCCGGCSVTIEILVQGSCFSPLGGLPGAVVAVRRNSDGVLLGTGTTDGTGHASITFTDTAPVDGGGTYDVQATKSPRWNASSVQTIEALCGETTTATQVTLTPATAYVCCNRCYDPIPKTLHLTDANGAVTLTWKPALGAWTGCYTKVQAGHTWTGYICNAATVTVAIGYSLQCPANGRFRLAQGWSACDLPGSTVGAPGACVGDSATAVGPGGRGSNFASGFLSQSVTPTCTPLNLLYSLIGAHVNGVILVTE